MRILSVHRKLSVIERCPYREVQPTETSTSLLIYITAKQVGKRGSSASRVFQGIIVQNILAKCKILETTLLEICESKDLTKDFRGTTRS